MTSNSTPPQVTDPHIQAALESLWRSNPHPAFLADRLAVYSHREPSLLPLVMELLEQLDEPDRGPVLARLAANPADTPPAEPEDPGLPAWHQAWQADNLPPLEVRLDPELGRLALALNKTGEFRVWVVARHCFGQPGWVERDTLYGRLKTHGVIHTKRHFNRLLAKGEGLFWGLAPDGRVWLRGYVKVSQRLTQLAARTAPELVATNIPGTNDVYLRVSGDIGDFKARLYAGWLAYRQDPKIARCTLAALFGCSEDTLRNWEARLGGVVEVITNYAQSAADPKEDDTIIDYLPEHAYSYVTRYGQIRLRWQQPNRYRTHGIREHPKNSTLSIC
jgi:hypothetical protein